jgi:phenylpropionate dioxygenase-like ring-hydroxylating dioxygenase large terminal subunit
MIKDQWYVVLRSKELGNGKPVGVTRMGQKMVFWRNNKGEPISQVDFCPHRGAALSIGWVKDEMIKCPFHGFEYDPSGRCTYVPANGKASNPPRSLQVKSYPTREANGYIYIWWGEEKSEYPPLPWFEDLDDSFCTAEFQDHWSVDYSRAIENQLDVFHLPFVHTSTIGRGERFVADGPFTVVDEKSLQIWVYNHTDDGLNPARRASELPAPVKKPMLIFKFPNLWMNRISDDMRITVFFTPIDDENCMLYLRAYQRFVRIPVLRNIVTWFLNPSNRYILNQDKRVVLTQRPRKTGLHIGEKLIPADKPIIEYRTIREKLQAVVEPVPASEK